MRRGLILCALIVAAGVPLVAAGRTGRTTAPIYTIDQVSVGLRRDPGAWTGRRIRVRGRVVQGSWVVRPHVASGLGLVSYGTPPQAPACAETPDGCPSPLRHTVLPPGTVIHLVLRSDIVCHAPSPCDYLLLQPQGASAFLTAVRRLPLVGSLLPPTQRVRWGTLALYRLQLLPRCRAGSVCDDGVLLDVTP